MSELRYNHLMCEWVVIATERAKRPSDFRRSKADVKDLPEYKDDCPFCPGNEGDLSDETFRIASSGCWKVRSILNKFPAFNTGAALVDSEEGMTHSMTGFGVAEVLIEHPHHNSYIAAMEDGQAQDIIRAYKERYLAISRIKGIKTVMIFKNHGPMAGTSIEHPHSQIIATPVIPMSVHNRAQSAIQYFRKTGDCIFCSIMKEEIEKGERMVLETAKFVSFVPYAASVPFAMWIFPRRHTPSFGEITDEEISDLANHLKTLLKKLYNGLGNPDFNYVIRSIPVYGQCTDSCHWFLNIVPRISQPAGFELGSGIFINTSLPEECASFLRQA